MHVLASFLTVCFSLFPPPMVPVTQTAHFTERLRNSGVCFLLLDLSFFHLKMFS